MRFSDKAENFISKLYHTAVFFAKMAVKENFRNYVSAAGPIDMSAQKSIVLLANGPSLTSELPALLEKEEFRGSDFLAVNYFAHSEFFARVKPKYYVLSDPTFFRDTVDRQKALDLYATLNAATKWPMNLYVQYYNPEKFNYRALLPNPNIRIVRFHSLPYRGFGRLEYPLYRRGIGSANFGSVIQNGEMVALQLGYKQLHLLGVDHTFFDGLAVDADNRVCLQTRYFYDGSTELQPLMLKSKNPPQPYTMHRYLAEKAELFRGHEVLAGFARYMGAEIINHTHSSLIDSYRRALSVNSEIS